MNKGQLINSTRSTVTTHHTSPTGQLVQVNKLSALHRRHLVKGKKCGSHCADIIIKLAMTLHRTTRLSNLRERQAERLAQETPDRR